MYTRSLYYAFFSPFTYVASFFNHDLKATGKGNNGFELFEKVEKPQDTAMCVVVSTQLTIYRNKFDKRLPKMCEKPNTRSCATACKERSDTKT
jgi:hypothetical protein